MPETWAQFLNQTLSRRRRRHPVRLGVFVPATVTLKKNQRNIHAKIC